MPAFEGDGQMSQSGHSVVDPVSHGSGRLVELTTDGVPAAQRLAFWRDGVLKRMEPTAASEAKGPFRARLRRISVDGAELVEHTSVSVVALRSAERRRIDGCDDISIDVMRHCQAALIDHRGERPLRSGDVCIVDYAQPITVRRSRHAAIGLILPRGRVREAMGDDVDSLAGGSLEARGMTAVLRHHLLTTLDEAPWMSPSERVFAVSVAADMALAVLQAGRLGAADVEQFGDGFYRAARRLIDHRCPDPDLTPERVALILGCSRASLYRMFARRGESVAATIWSTRIERAWRMLTMADGGGLLISDIAMRCGFRELPTFTRMFKRRYGMTPREAREQRPT
jgi:AraC-like DNA-binding protein